MDFFLNLSVLDLAFKVVFLTEIGLFFRVVYF